MKPGILILVFVAILIPLSLMGQALDTLIVGSPILMDPDSGTHLILGCPSGYQVVSGGWDGAGGSNQLFVTRSFPGNMLDQWEFTFKNAGNATVTVYPLIICKRVPPSAVLKGRPGLPERSRLGQNYPNPFNPLTKFEYTLNNRGNVRVEVFNEVGQLITTFVDGVMEAGNYRISWNGKSSSGTGVSSGTYFYRLTTDGVVQTKKMIMVK